MYQNIILCHGDVKTCDSLYVSLIINSNLFLDGLDFFFATPQDAKKFISFLQSVVPCRYFTVSFG